MRIFISFLFLSSLAYAHQVQWLGTAGWKLDYQEHTILIDPYLSRKPLKNPGEMSTLLTAQAYETFCQTSA